MPLASAEDYLEDARREYKRALRSFKDKDYEYACFHSQQCAELALKAFLVKHGNYLRVHNLVALYERARERFGLKLRIALEDLSRLSVHYSAARYRNARMRVGLAYDEGEAKRCLTLAKEVLKGIERTLKA